MCILNILTDLCSIKQNTRVKKYFCKNCLQCFSSKKILSEHKKDCLVINDKQNVKLESGFISFKNYSKQIHVALKFMLILNVF